MSQTFNSQDKALSAITTTPEAPEQAEDTSLRTTRLADELLDSELAGVAGGSLDFGSLNNKDPRP